MFSSAGVQLWPLNQTQLLLLKDAPGDCTSGDLAKQKRRDLGTLNCLENH